MGGGGGSSADSSTSMDGSDKSSNAGGQGGSSQSSYSDNSQRSSNSGNGGSSGGGNKPGSSSPPFLLAIGIGAGVGAMLAQAFNAKKNRDAKEEKDNADKMKEEDDMLRDEADKDQPDEEKALGNDDDIPDADQATNELMVEATIADQEAMQEEKENAGAELEEVSVRLEARAAELAQMVGLHRHGQNDDSSVRRRQRAKLGKEKAMAATEESMMAFENELPQGKVEKFGSKQFDLDTMNHGHAHPAQFEEDEDEDDGDFEEKS